MDPRYSRQTRFSGIGEDGQHRLGQALALIVGCGALGTHLAETLVRAGVGRVRIVDRDVVEETNLQRQSIFDERDARDGIPKALAAQRRLREVNSHVTIEAIAADFTNKNAEELATGIDVIVDATDNFETRFLINDVAIKLGLPWVYAACLGSTSMVMPVIPGETACFACLIEEMPPAGGDTCDTAGVIMPAVMISSAIAGAEALKLLAGRRAELIRKVQVHDCWSGHHAALDASKPRDGCPVCLGRSFAYLSGRMSQQAVSLCGRNTVQITPQTKLRRPLADVAAGLSGAATVLDCHPFLLRVEARGKRISLFPDGRALVSGTSDLGEARSLYAQLIGS
ncbi:MAG: ThiF family adenylyltransferase [Planctomycetes bacterium]|nr:ThiF family adenylyltransferase [Planctomycetota bacterium]NUQ33707.1 ThiF family adenylyltransferase [Planctomycetaceae bacterium]